MPFQIPNEADAANADQAEPDSRDFKDILTPSFQLSGVVSGCAVTAQGTPDMTVAVAAGVVSFQSAWASVAAGNVTITAANATNPRFDLICADSAGTKSAVAGTAAANPVFPDPAGKIVLAAVYVPANQTTIPTSLIVDKRVLIPPWSPINTVQTVDITPLPANTSVVVVDDYEIAAGNILELGAGAVMEAMA